MLFYAGLLTAGLGAAYVAALSCSYATLARRCVRRDPVPAILVIGVIGITVRTLVAVVSRSSFVYFFQPVLGSIAMGCVFLISVAIRKPLIATLAHEFWPLSPEVATRAPSASRRPARPMDMDAEEGRGGFRTSGSMVRSGKFTVSVM